MEQLTTGVSWLAVIFGALISFSAGMIRVAIAWADVTSTSVMSTDWRVPENSMAQCRAVAIERFGLQSVVSERTAQGPLWGVEQTSISEYLHSFSNRPREFEGEPLNTSVPKLWPAQSGLTGLSGFKREIVTTAPEQPIDFIGL